jgi:D-glycero-D-manno-heptose 1,7-bisphosphate phosphatase
MRPDTTAVSDAPKLRPAAFLDRDGVINVDHGYTFRPADLRLTPTAAEGIRLLNDAGYLVIVVTNQSGVARGLYGTSDVEAFHARMTEALREQGARIDAYYYCAYHPEGTIAEYARDHEDRKPGAGMLMRAMADLPVDPARSFMIGDKPSDAQAAERAGLPARLIPANEGDLAAAVREMMA